MILVCDKFKDSMDSNVAECRHPNGYCQSRKSCMIWFLEKERKREEALKRANASKGQLL